MLGPSKELHTAIWVELNFGGAGSFTEFEWLLITYVACYAGVFHRSLSWGQIGPSPGYGGSVCWAGPYPSLAPAAAGCSCSCAQRPQQ